VGTLVTAALAEAAGEPLQGALEADGVAQSGDGALLQSVDCASALQSTWRYTSVQAPTGW
jgi:hypothetical protein